MTTGGTITAHTPNASTGEAFGGATNPAIQVFGVPHQNKMMLASFPTVMAFEIGDAVCLKADKKRTGKVMHHVSGAVKVRWDDTGVEECKGRHFLARVTPKSNATTVKITEVPLENLRMSDGLGNATVG